MSTILTHMSFKFLKSNQIKLYKRENSKYWQMKIKLPKQQAVRSSTGFKTLKDAEQIAIKSFISIVMFSIFKKKKQYSNKKKS